MNLLNFNGRKTKPAPGVLTVFKSPDEADRAIGETLAKALDIRTRIQREREGIEKRLGKLRAEAEASRQDIAARSADLAELERIIEGMEAHYALISDDPAAAPAPEASAQESEAE